MPDFQLLQWVRRPSYGLGLEHIFRVTKCGKHCVHVQILQAGLFDMPQVDLLVRTGGLNTGRVYLDSDKIRVGCVSGSGRIPVGYISVLWVLDQHNEFNAPFPRLFSFL